MSETMPRASTALNKPDDTAVRPRLVRRRVVDDVLATAAPGRIVLLEAAPGSGKSSAITASAGASRVLLAQADRLSPVEIRRLERTATAAGKVVVLTAVSRRPRVRLLALGRDPVIVTADHLRFDASELAQAARLADVLLTRPQIARVLRLTDGWPRLVAALLGALPRDSETTDDAIEACWLELSAHLRDRIVGEFGEPRLRRIESLLRDVPVITAPMRPRLVQLDDQVGQILGMLEADGFAGRTERFGETAMSITPVFRAAEQCEDAEWNDLVRTEYARVGADVELAARAVDEADWRSFRLLVRRRYPQLIRTGDRFAFLLAQVPSEVMAVDGWLIVVERMLADELGTFAPVRRVRKPSSALPTEDRAWLQSSKVHVELSAAAFSKAVAEASFLVRLLEQTADDDGTTADLWMHSSLPAFLTGNHVDAIRRSTTAIGLATRHSRRHVELFSGGVIALTHALRGEMRRAGETLHELLAGCDIAGFERTSWEVPAQIAHILVHIEGNDLVAADRVLSEVREDRLGPFWPVYAVAVGRRALAGGQGRAVVGLDRLRLIEQSAGEVPASNRQRGMLAAVTALLHLSLGRPDDAARELRPFDDGRETSMLPSALIHLAQGDTDGADALTERFSGRNAAPITLVSAAALRTLPGRGAGEPADREARERLSALARECGLEHFAELVVAIGTP